MALMMCEVFRRLKSWSLTKQTARGAVVKRLPLRRPKAVVYGGRSSVEEDGLVSGLRECIEAASFETRCEEGNVARQGGKYDGGV